MRGQNTASTVQIPRGGAGDALQLLHQLPGTVWVPAGGVQQGFAEGVAVSLLTHARPLLPAHVLVFLLEVRAELEEPRSPRGAALFFQPVSQNTRRGGRDDGGRDFTDESLLPIKTHKLTCPAVSKSFAEKCPSLCPPHLLRCPPTSPVLEKSLLRGRLVYFSSTTTQRLHPQYF